MQEIKYTSLFITQSYFPVPKDVRLNSTHYKRELQNIATNRPADIDYKNFISICRKCTSKPYTFLAIDILHYQLIFHDLENIC